MKSHCTFEYRILHVLCQGMHESRESTGRSRVSKKAQVVFLPHTQAMKTKHDQLLENVPDTTDGICHIFIFKGAAFSH